MDEARENINPPRIFLSIFMNFYRDFYRHIFNYTIQQKFLSVNLTMDFSSFIRWLTCNFPIFYNTSFLRYYQSKWRKRPFWPNFRVLLDIKQQYLKSKYLTDVIENSFLFDFFNWPLVFSSIRTRVIINKLKLHDYKKDNKYK